MIPIATLLPVTDTDSLGLPPARLGDTDSLSDPPIDVSPSVADVFADPETHRALSAVSPCVQRFDRDIQEVDEVFGREKAVVFFHDRIVPADPVSRVSSRCHLGSAPHQDVAHWTPRSDPLRLAKAPLFYQLEGF